MGLAQLHCLIPDQLHTRAKITAVMANKTMTQLVVEGLEKELDAAQESMRGDQEREWK